MIAIYSKTAPFRFPMVFLAEEQVDLTAFIGLSSPIYRLELSLVGRLFAQDQGIRRPSGAAAYKHFNICSGAVNLVEMQDRDGLICFV